MGWRQVDPRNGVERALAAVDERESVVRAFAHLDYDRARLEAQDRATADGPLRGMTVGVKDIFDTADQPTEYGSPFYAGYRPRADAAAVALLRQAGAVVVGKTVTAEFAWFTPGPTTNPHRASHTPGGSSSGSAAAVAADMVDVAIGTQTAGSVIRPASFCGVIGYKPTFGWIPTAGVKPAAPSLDTVGIFAREMDALVAAAEQLTGRELETGAAAPTFVLVPTDQWERADADSCAVVERAADAVGAPRRDLPPAFLGLADDQPTVQAFEGLRSLAFERGVGAISDGLASILAWGAAIAPAAYDQVRRRAAIAAQPENVDALFGSATALVTPAVPGEAPEGIAATGDPRFCRLWTLLGLPAITLPVGSGATGLPIGVQLVGRHGDDARLLTAARVLLDRARV